jgi:hypothetical protein
VHHQPALLTITQSGDGLLDIAFSVRVLPLQSGWQWNVVYHQYVLLQNLIFALFGID